MGRLAKLEGASPDAPNFFGSAGALPSKTVRLRLKPTHFCLDAPLTFTP